MVWVLLGLSFAAAFVSMMGLLESTLCYFKGDHLAMARSFWFVSCPLWVLSMAFMFSAGRIS